MTGDSLIMFIDMNSFFASCEQQHNYYLRGRPVGVCVYTGKYGCIISPSIEAKKFGVKTGMRLNEAVKLCPDLVPLETNPTRYREIHVHIMKMLRGYCQEVYPKSIDEAIIDLSTYKHIYKDPYALAREIKQKISKIGDWLQCSIGIAPNAFLAKLASDLKKPNGLVSIFPENIDEVLSTLKLTDLPGIAGGISGQLIKAGIKTPLELRYASADKLRAALHSVVGIYWHQRLNFIEADIEFHEYKTMQAMRQVSAAQRHDLKAMQNLLVSLCMMLEKRMVGQQVYAKEVSVFINYENGKTWNERIHAAGAVQEGTKILDLIKARMKKYRETHHSDEIINTHIVAMGLTVGRFIPSDALALDLFEDTVKQDKLRQTVYNIKDKYGYDKLLKAIEINDDSIMDDVIGFGSVKDMYDKSAPSVV